MHLTQRFLALLGATWLAGCAGIAPATNSETSAAKSEVAIAPVEQVLSRQHRCSASLSLRSQALLPAQEATICQDLAAIEQRFHQLFHTAGKPVANDLNDALRANIYASSESFKRHAGAHFNMPTNNGGMYLEGLPGRAGNQAEFVANQNKYGTVLNLGHEFVHYLDGRYNLYGDFCANLHDSHDAPENCPKPAPLTPYLVWWTEGIAEYISRGDINPKAVALALDEKRYALSELFDTGYISNGGSPRVYSWGYLAVRFMMERHRGELEPMLAFTRRGDYPRYQALLRGWGKRFDGEFSLWLQQIQPGATSAGAAAPAAQPEPAH